MLNRQRWDAACFHQMMATLARVAPGDHVLDLGCGRGATLGSLIERAGESGRVFGLDRMDRSLKEAGARYAAAVESGRLVLVQGEVLDLPFPDDTFEVVVCQNVIERVDDCEAAVVQARRVLKPGGRLLLGHHDFDGIVLASDDRDLTRRLVHGFADHKQDWQEAADGQMGRMIPALVANVGFATVEIETKMFVDLNLDEGSYARDYVGWLADLAPALGIERDQVERWATSLEKAAAQERFFFGLPWVAAVCVK